MTDQKEPSDLGAELAADQAAAFPQRDEPAEIKVSGGVRLPSLGGGNRG